MASDNKAVFNNDNNQAVISAILACHIEGNSWDVMFGWEWYFKKLGIKGSLTVRKRPDRRKIEAYKVKKATWKLSISKQSIISQPQSYKQKVAFRNILVLQDTSLRKLLRGNPLNRRRPIKLRPGLILGIPSIALNQCQQLSKLQPIPLPFNDRFIDGLWTIPVPVNHSNIHELTVSITESQGIRGSLRVYSFVGWGIHHHWRLVQLGQVYCWAWCHDEVSDLCGNLCQNVGRKRKESSVWQN